MSTPNALLYYQVTSITQDNCEEYGDEELIGQYCLALTTKEYWDKHKCQIDYTPEWMYKILESLDFPAADCENTFIINQALMDNIRDDERFYESPEFKVFMKIFGDEIKQ